MIKIVHQILELDGYIGSVARSEVHFWSMNTDMLSTGEDKEMSFPDRKVLLTPEKEKFDIRISMSKDFKQTSVEDTQEMHMGLQVLS